MFQKYGQKFSMEDVHMTTVGFINHLNAKDWGLAVTWPGGKPQYVLYDLQHHADAVKIRKFDDVLKKWGSLVAGGAVHAAQLTYFKSCIESDSYSVVKDALDFIETGNMSKEIKNGVMLATCAVEELEYEEQLTVAGTISSRYDASIRKGRDIALREDLDVLKDKAVGRCLELSTKATQSNRERARI